MVLQQTIPAMTAHYFATCGRICRARSPATCGWAAHGMRSWRWSACCWRTRCTTHRCVEAHGGQRVPHSCGRPGGHRPVPKACSCAQLPEQCAAAPAQVGYCQGLNFLAGMLLLVLQRDEERSFWVLVSLLDEGALHPASSHGSMISHSQVGLQHPLPTLLSGLTVDGALCRHPVQGHVLAQPAGRACRDAVARGASLPLMLGTLPLPGDNLVTDGTSRAMDT
jgi:Rab-GTPase-TBC domain